MKDKLLYSLLDAVNRKYDIRKLVNEGLNYKTISDLITFALKEEFVVYKNNTIEITEKGIVKMDSDAKEFKKTNKEEWILPDEKNRRKDKIDKNDIFLPRQDELKAL